MKKTIAAAKEEKQILGLVKIYNQVKEALREANVLRSERLLQSDYAEWLVARRLGLKLSDNKVQKGSDATDRRGKKYQIKARIVKKLEDSTSFNFRSFEHDFDFMVGVFFDKDLNLLLMFEVTRKSVLEMSKETKNEMRFRWSRETMKDPRIRIVGGSPD